MHQMAHHPRPYSMGLPPPAPGMMVICPVCVLPPVNNLPQNLSFMLSSAVEMRSVEITIGWWVPARVSRASESQVRLLIFVRLLAKKCFAGGFLNVSLKEASTNLVLVRIWRETPRCNSWANSVPPLLQFCVIRALLFSVDLFLCY